MNENEILESALADAMHDREQTRQIIIRLIDAKLRDTKFYTASIKRFSLLSKEIRILRDALNR